MYSGLAKGVTLARVVDKLNPVKECFPTTSGCISKFTSAFKHSEFQDF